MLQRVNRDTMSFGEPCWVPVHLCLGSAVPASGAWMVHRTQTSVAHIGSLNCFCSCPAFATKRFCSGVPSDCCRSNPARPSPLQQPPHDPPPHTFLCSPAAASCVVPHFLCFVVQPLQALPPQVCVWSPAAATKLCHIKYEDGTSADIMKLPKSDLSKYSLPGAMAVKRVDGVPTAFPADGGHVAPEENMLKVCWDKGPVKVSRAVIGG